MSKPKPPVDEFDEDFDNFELPKPPPPKNTTGNQKSDTSKAKPQPAVPKKDEFLDEFDDPDLTPPPKPKTNQIAAQSASQGLSKGDQKFLDDFDDDFLDSKDKKPDPKIAPKGDKSGAANTKPANAVQPAATTTDKAGTSSLGVGNQPTQKNGENTDQQSGKLDNASSINQAGNTAKDVTNSQIQSQTGQGSKLDTDQRPLKPADNPNLAVSKGSDAKPLIQKPESPPAKAPNQPSNVPVGKTTDRQVLSAESKNNPQSQSERNQDQEQSQRVSDVNQFREESANRTSRVAQQIEGLAAGMRKRKLPFPEDEIQLWQETPEYQEAITRNQRLASDLQEIAESTHQLQLKEHQARENRHPTKTTNDYIKELLTILTDQKKTIIKLKEEVRTKQKNLDSVYNYPEAIDRENQIKDLKRQLNQVLQEKHALVGVSKQQEEEIRLGSLDDQMKTEINQLATEFHQKKEEYRRLQEENKHLDKKLGENHLLICGMRKKYDDHKKRALKLKAAYEHEAKSREANKQQPNDKVDLAELQTRYAELVNRRDEANLAFKEEYKEYEALYKRLKAENGRTSKHMSDLNKEMVMGSIRLKKLKRDTPEEFMRDREREAQAVKSRERQKQYW